MPTCPYSKWEFSTGEEQSQGEMKFIDHFQISGPRQAIEQWTETSGSRLLSVQLDASDCETQLSISIYSSWWLWSLA